MKPFVVKGRLFAKQLPIQLDSQIVRVCGVIVLGLLLAQSVAIAQPDQSEHESHHPAAAPSTTPSSNAAISTTPSSPTPADAAVSPDAALMGSPGPENNPPQSSSSMPNSPTSGSGMMEGMQKMMKDMMAPSKQGDAEACCGGSGASRKELYPFLMSLPTWTRESRLQVERLAQERIQKGTSNFQTSHASLSKALQTGDLKATELALQQSRDSLGMIASGVAAHRLLIEGATPQNVAAQWFKREMNLTATSMASDSDVLHGVTTLHLFAMGLLIAFALAMVIMYFFKMRRAANLFGRIKPDSGSPPPGASPPLGGAPNSPSPVAPPDANSASPKVVPPSTVADPKSPTAEKPQATDSLPKGSFTALNAGKDLALPLAANWRGQLRVGSIIRETPNVRTLRLLPASSAGLMPFTFVPGQFLNLSFSIGGARMNRSYSISSSPTRREYVDLTVKREPRGAVSRHIVDLLKVGNEVEVGGPVGRFTFTGAEAQSIVLISGGVGITPMMSISRYLTEQSWNGDIYFIYGCSAPAEFIFAKDIAELQRANPKLHVTVTMERLEGIDWQGPQGRITKELLAQTVPDIASRRVHLCGPQVMMEAVKAMLNELKIPPEQVKTENFGTAAPTPATNGTAAKPITPATGPLVTFSKNNKSAKIHVDQTVLELSEELDIGIEFSCRVGTCGICKVKMTSGEVEMAVEDGLDADDKVNGIILACQAKPINEIAVEA